VWDTLSGALAGRSLFLIDSDKVPGQRNIFLVDPEWFRPSILMPSRAPPTRPEEP
jgi:hypothetical protein